MREKGRERERGERDIDQLLPVGALTEDGTHDLSGARDRFQPTEPPSQGNMVITFNYLRDLKKLPNHVTVTQKGRIKARR